jgi:hypothetical protein
MNLLSLLLSSSLKKEAADSPLTLKGSEAFYWLCAKNARGAM